MVKKRIFSTPTRSAKFRRLFTSEDPVSSADETTVDSTNRQNRSSWSNHLCPVICIPERSRLQQGSPRQSGVEAAQLPSSVDLESSHRNKPGNLLGRTCRDFITSSKTRQDTPRKARQEVVASITTTPAWTGSLEHTLSSHHVVSSGGKLSSIKERSQSGLVAVVRRQPWRSCKKTRTASSSVVAVEKKSSHILIGSISASAYQTCFDVDAAASRNGNALDNKNSKRLPNPLPNTQLPGVARRGVPQMDHSSTVNADPASNDLDTEVFGVRTESVDKIKQFQSQQKEQLVKGLLKADNMLSGNTGPTSLDLRTHEVSCTGLYRSKEHDSSSAEEEGHSAGSYRSADDTLRTDDNGRCLSSQVFQDAAVMATTFGTSDSLLSAFADSWFLNDITEENDNDDQSGLDTSDELLCSFEAIQLQKAVSEKNIRVNATLCKNPAASSIDDGRVKLPLTRYIPSIVRIGHTVPPWNYGDYSTESTLSDSTHTTHRTTYAVKQERVGDSALSDSTLTTDHTTSALKEASVEDTFHEEEIVDPLDSFLTESPPHEQFLFSPIHRHVTELQAAVAYGFMVGCDFASSTQKNDDDDDGTVCIDKNFFRDKADEISQLSEFARWDILQQALQTSCLIFPGPNGEL